MRNLVISLASAAVAGCASSVSGTLPIYGDAYYSMPPEGLASRIDVTNDPLDGYKLVSSHRVRAKYVDFAGVDSSISFRAFVWNDGKDAVQVYIETESSDWLYPTTLNFGSPLRSVPVDSLGTDVTCRSGGCDHFETVIARLSPADVRQMLAPNTPDLFEVRLKTQSGIDVDRTLRKDELRAVLAAAGITERY